MKKSSNFFLIIIVLSLFGCQENNKRESPYSLIQGDTINHKFLSADRTRNSGSYKDALFQYARVEKKYHLTENELRYIKLNIQLCNMLTTDTLTYVARKSIDTLNDSRTGIIENIIAGLVEIRNGRSGMFYLQKASESLLRNKKTINTFEYLLTLESIGINHRRVEGKMDSALLYFEKALLVTKSFEEFSPHTPRLLLEIADVCLIYRNEVTALGYVNEALRNFPDPQLMSKALIFKGILFRKLEEYDSAERAYQNAEEVIIKFQLQSIMPQLLNEKILMAIILNDEESFQVLMDTLTAFPASFLKKDEINTDRLWGYYYYFKNLSSEKCIYHYERALKSLDAERIPDLVLLMQAFYILTEQYLVIKNYDKAEEYAYKSLVYNTSLRDKSYSWENVLDPEIANVSNNFVNYGLLAEIFLSRSKEVKPNIDLLKKALKLYTFIDSLMLQQVRVVEEEAAIKFLLIGNKVYSGGIEACYSLYRKTLDTAYVNQAHQFMERGKALIMYRDILARSKSYFPNVPSDFRNKEFQMKATISALRKAMSFRSGEMMHALEELNAYYAEMEQKYPEYYKAKYKLSIPPFHYFQKASLHKHMNIIQYHMTEKHLYFLKYDATAQFERIELDTTLREALLGLRNILDRSPGLGDDNTLRKFMKYSHTLYSSLISPMHLTNHLLLIIPDGALHYIPFEILVSDPLRNFKNANYLVKDYIINYAQSLKTYELTANTGDQSINNILTYAYGKSNNNLVSLPGTEKEAELIREIFDNQSVTRRHNEQVTRDRLLKDLEKKYDLIHIGLHASSSTSDRLENKIYCSGDDGEASQVYGFEIAPLNIQAHTIVLTSCQSAYGPNIPGEGTYSLARAFKQTGVNNVISSLWNITDNTTADITGSFYHFLSTGHSPSESLANAKRKYISSADEITAHPYFWAGMICQGN